MKNEFQVLPRSIINLFLWMGLIAGICVRLLMILNRVNPEAAIWVWRFAMACYTLFFGYRYLITRRRKSMITRHALIQQVQTTEALDPNVQKALLYILNSIQRSKELFNYAFICILSLIALILDFFA